MDKTEDSKACLRNNNPNNSFEEESKRKLKRNFLYLKEELNLDDLLDHFIQDGIFTPDEEENVRQAGSRRNQADVFLRLLLRPSKISSYPKFLRILGETKCGHIRTKLESESTESNLPDYKNFDAVKVTSVVCKLREELVRDPDDPTRIAEYFLQHEVFSLDEYENIIQEKTNKLKVETIFDTIQNSQNLKRSYAVLVYVLAKEDKHLSEKLTKIFQTESKEIQVSDEASNFCFVVDGSIYSSEDFEDVDGISITLCAEDCNSKAKKRKEKKIFKKIKKHKNKLSSVFESETECLISDIEKGSIVIKIKESKKGAIKHLFENGLEEAVTKILKTLFSQSELSKMCNQGTKYLVKVEILRAPKREIKGCIKAVPKEMISSNYPLLVEELEALGFLKLDIFTEEERDRIMKSRPISRAESTKVLVDIVLTKCENDIIIFLEEIKQRKPFVWSQIYPTGSEIKVDDDRSDTESGYQTLRVTSSDNFNQLPVEMSLRKDDIIYKTGRKQRAPLAADVYYGHDDIYDDGDSNDYDKIPMKMKVKTPVVIPPSDGKHFEMKPKTLLTWPRRITGVFYGGEDSKYTSHSLPSRTLSTAKYDSHPAIQRVQVTPSGKKRFDLISNRKSHPHSITISDLQF